MKKELFKTTASLFLILIVGVRAEKPLARSVIQIWLGGGPAHLDTFDPKPNAGDKYCGPYKKVLPTNIEGISLCQTLPLLAKQADKYALLRGMTHGVNGHETATYIMQACTMPADDLVYPSVGAIVGLKKPSKSSLPHYICVPTSMGRFSPGGFLGVAGQPFVINGKMKNDEFLISGVVREGSNEDRVLQRRLKLLAEQDPAGHSEKLKQWDTVRTQAAEVLGGASRDVFDLAHEPADLRARYGNNDFGQSCLLARRLVEDGVPFITVVDRKWDSHKDHFDQMEKKLPTIDKGLSALLEDLDKKGLLESTIVLCGGEFGRKPLISYDSPWNGGRQHFGAAFSWLIAGGGFEGGKVVGATDGKGEKVIRRPIYPGDLAESLYERLGIDLDDTLPHPRGIEVFVRPHHSEKRGGKLDEIM